MSIVKWARTQLERNRRSRRAISTIMANLTMLIIVVFLSSMLFVWAVSSFGAYQGGAGYWFSSRSIANQERVSVENVFFYTSGPTTFAKIYVRNVGAIPFTVGSTYLNGTIYNIPQQTVNVNNVVLVFNNSTGLPLTQSLGKGDVQTIKIATLRGTIVTSTWVA